MRDKQYERGAYFRQNVCGTITGKLEGVTLNYRWAWQGNEGTGTANQTGDKMFTIAKFDMSPDKYLQIELKRVQ